MFKTLVVFGQEFYLTADIILQREGIVNRFFKIFYFFKKTGAPTCYCEGFARGNLRLRFLAPLRMTYGIKIRFPRSLRSLGMTWERNGIM